MQKIILISIVLALTLSSCGLNKNSELQTGIWRAELKVGSNQAPFLFEVSSRSGDSTIVTLINGEERVELEGITYLNDSVTIPIEAYDAYIKAAIGNNSLNGRFVKNYIENDSGVPFKAEFNNLNRFESIQNPTDISVDGKWDIDFITQTGDTSHNVGVFKTSNKIVTGSILTNSGDLRFLEGAYTETGVQLSAFSGLSPYLININFENENAFTGSFFTTRGETKLIGRKNNKAGLADPYSLTKLKKGKKSLNFSLPNVEGKTISLSDSQYQNKVLIISILGSWCPNCLDEMKYLSPWYKVNKKRGVEIIGLAFERKDEFEYAQGTLSRLKKKYDTEYEILFGGKVGEEATAKALPEIEKITSYPTTIFIDKKGIVRKIHTGFNGPATGLFYEEFQKDFNKLVDDLLAE